jgi:hypothetical protein
MARKVTTKNFTLLFRGGVQPSDMPRDEMERLMENWYQWMGQLTKRRQLKLAHPLDHAGRVLSGRKGKVVKPFTESKDSIGGYLLIQAKSLGDAQKIARGCPILERGGSVEIRPVLSM